MRAMGGNVNEISEKVLKIERQALRRCLQVKSGTTNELIYLELNRPDIISTIKDRQFSFREKITSLDPSEAFVRNIWDMCDSEGDSMKKYYLELKDDNRICNIEEKKQSVLNPEKTMCTRYVRMINNGYSETLYNSMLDDSKRKMITRWRLSSHKLKVETGRYGKTTENQRNCLLCDTLEDEYHSLFICKAHVFIRSKFKKLLTEYNNVRKILNPPTIIIAEEVAKYLEMIEENMKNLKMV